MCSLIFSTKEVKDVDSVNRVTKFRGPDLTSIETIDGFTYIHNLLSITGNKLKQPFTDIGIVCFYNGEIYNHGDFGNFESDGQCLIPAYKKHGPHFTKFLDGEFAIVLVDNNQKIIIVSSDTFKTKPIFYSVDNLDLGVSTYSEPLKKIGYKEILKVPANTTIVFDYLSKKIINKFNVVNFDVTRQYKNNLNDWILAYEESIRKRTKNIRENVFIGLSSGYDSGAICCELLKQKIKFKSYTLRGTENENVLLNRILLLNNNGIDYKILNKFDNELNNTISYIKENTEDFKYTICSSSSDYNEFGLSLTDDGGSRNLSYICSEARKDNCKIMLSGMGPDEIYSDYGFNGNKIYSHSNFGGLFPQDLDSIFPWNSFFGSSMESYIAKEEYVGGSYGIEVRYPFLDKKLVQEFLWLDVNLKNKSYKHPLDYYLQNNNFPYNKGEKLGF